MWLTALLKWETPKRMWVQKRAIIDKKEISFSLLASQKNKERDPFIIHHGAAMLSFLFWPVPTFFPFCPNPTSLQPTQSPIISIQCHCDPLLACWLVKQTDKTERRGLICTDKQNICYLTFNDNLNGETCCKHTANLLRRIQENFYLYGIYEQTMTLRL